MSQVRGLSCSSGLPVFIFGQNEPHGIYRDVELPIGLASLPIRNDFCGVSRRCRGGPCWRVLCAGCSGYLSMHYRSDEAAFEAAEEALAHHLCLPSGLQALSWIEQDLARLLMARRGWFTSRW